MNRSQHSFKKQFGQNFLKHQRYGQQMVDQLKIQSDDIVIEIGPGDGMVTELLLRSPAKLVISIEVDYSLIPNLIRRLGEYENYELIYANILDVDWRNLADQMFNENNAQIYRGQLAQLNEEIREPNSNIKFVGSLPYNISKVIIERALTTWPLAASMAFIIQEEVAQDYTAAVPQASFLATWARLYAKVSKKLSIPAAEFFPKPKVDGRIITITPYENQPTAAEAMRVAKFIKHCFLQPRKTLHNNTKSLNLTLPEDIQRKRPGEVDLIELYRNLQNDQK